MSSKKNDLINTVNEISTIAKSRGIAHLYTQDKILNGRTILVNEKQLINFGSCSYLGIEVDERLKQGGIDGIKKYGSQYSSSRTYVATGSYLELEDLITQIFECPVIISTCTTLSHQAVMPIVIGENDAVIYDQQAHVSMQEMMYKLKHQGTTITMVRHNRMADLKNKIEELYDQHEKIWYVTDSVFSMYGDFLNIDEVVNFLTQYKKLYLYADDAHGMSWIGKHGSGWLKSKIGNHPKVISVTSFAKGFASAGGIAIIPDKEMFQRVKLWGGPNTYSGPQQPAVIGASISSAKIHLSSEIAYLQDSLALKIKYCNELLVQYKLPVVAITESPIFFIGLGIPKLAYNIIEKLMKSGFYVNIGIFPAVPETCSGIRFTVTTHHSFHDIELLVAAIAKNLPIVLEEENKTIKDIFKAFRKITSFEHIPTDNLTSDQTKKDTTDYNIRYEKSIQNISKEKWDSFFGDKGAFDWDNLKLLEETFINNNAPEDNWEFHYYLIKNKQEKTVLATFFTTLLTKDDMLSPVEVSRKVEEKRKKDPYYMTSKMLMMGTAITNGQHLYLDKTDNWQIVLKLLLSEVEQLYQTKEIDILNLRDFNSNDIELRDFLIDQGYIKIGLPNDHIINLKSIDSIDKYLLSLQQRKRSYIRREVVKMNELFEVRLVKKYTKQEIKKWYELYLNVHKNNLGLNMFPLPEILFNKMAYSKKWEIIELRVKGKNDRTTKEPQSIAFSYINKPGICSFSIIGLDYDYLKSHSLYKQNLFLNIKRAIELKCHTIYWGLTTSNIKKKFDAEVIPQCSYIRVKDHYKMALMNTFSSDG